MARTGGRTCSAARLLLVLGTLVAITSTSRLSPLELVTSVPSFAYVLVVQLAGIAAVVRALAPEKRVLHVYGLYLAGHGPWLAALLGVCAVYIFATDPARVLLTTAPFVALVTAGWGGVLTYACFRRVVGLTRRRAWAGLGLFYLVMTTCVLAYFVVAGQLLPILPSEGAP